MTSAELHEDRDQLRDQVAFLTRHVDAVADELDAAQCELMETQKLLADIEARLAAADADAPAVVGQ